LVFFIIPINLKPRVALSTDLILFDTNINRISRAHINYICFKFTHMVLPDTHFKMGLFLFSQTISYVVKTKTC